MKIDKTTTSIIVGALSTIPYEILTTVLKLLGYARYSVYELSSLMITLNRPHMLLGAFLSMTLGASIALILYKIAVECFGWENLIFKKHFSQPAVLDPVGRAFMWLIEGAQSYSVPADQ